MSKVTHSDMADPEVECVLRQPPPSFNCFRLTKWKVFRLGKGNFSLICLHMRITLGGIFRSGILSHQLVFSALSVDLPTISLAGLGSPVNGTCEQKNIGTGAQTWPCITIIHPPSLLAGALDLYRKSLSKLTFRMAGLNRATFEVLSKLFLAVLVSVFGASVLFDTLAIVSVCLVAPVSVWTPGVPCCICLEMAKLWLSSYK